MQSRKSKVIAARKSGLILGTTIICEAAGELIHEFALAMNNMIALEKLASTIHAYPKRSEAVRKAAAAFARTRLTAGKQSFLTGLFRCNLP